MAKPIGADKARRSGSLGEAIGAELTRLRTEREWTQQYVADLLGYDISFIGQIERGQKSPTVRTLISFADAFGVPLSSIIAAAEKRVSKEGTRNT